MDEQAVRAALTHYLAHSGTDEDTAHEIYHPDAVLEFPQSGERFEGVANFREWRRRYPAAVSYELGRYGYQPPAEVRAAALAALYP
ncbi:hypothetical protein [Micromonospora sp. IBHARD004]|uniref:hypothetical protein n=1 Tax=Micromonospora sp. IBHARD004 TaxID=3457764 RepID=UPI004059F3F0